MFLKEDTQFSIIFLGLEFRLTIDFFPLDIQFSVHYFSRAEIRVQFRHVPGNLYNRNFGTDLDRATNELVIRVQPDEAIYLKINNKVPGLGMRLDRSNLNLHYAAR